MAFQKFKQIFARKMKTIPLETETKKNEKKHNKQLVFQITSFKINEK